MKHEYEDNIICPYCGWVDDDSWEFNEEEGKFTCEECDEEFTVVKEVSVSYSSYRISCESKGLEHDFKVELIFQNAKGIYYEKSTCTICGEDDYKEISEEEYNNSNNFY